MEIFVGGIDGKIVVFVDDVFFFGCSICVVLDVIQLIGCLLVVCFVILVDCGYCELFICFDFVGKNIFFVCIEWVNVCLFENDGVEEVMIGE